MGRSSDEILAQLEMHFNYITPEGERKIRAEAGPSYSPARKTCKVRSKIFKSKKYGPSAIAARKDPIKQGGAIQIIVGALMKLWPYVPGDKSPEQRIGTMDERCRALRWQLSSLFYYIQMQCGLTPGNISYGS